MNFCSISGQHEPATAKRKRSQVLGPSSHQTTQCAPDEKQLQGLAVDGRISDQKVRLWHSDDFLPDGIPQVLDDLKLKSPLPKPPRASQSSPPDYQQLVIMVESMIKRLDARLESWRSGGFRLCEVDLKKSKTLDSVRDSLLAKGDFDIIINSLSKS